MRKKWLLISLLVVALAGFTLAATTWDQTFARFTNIWVGVTGDTPSYTLGSNSAYVKGDVEVDGTLYADGNLYLGGGLYPSGTAAVRSFDLPLRDAFVSSPGLSIGPGSGAAMGPLITTPDLGTTDGIPVIIFMSSIENSSVGWTFRVPPDYASGLNFRLLMSSNRNMECDGTSSAGLGWTIFVNEDSGLIATAGAPVMRQTSYVPTSGTTGWDTTNAIWTFTPNTTALAEISAGSIVTVNWQNEDVRYSPTFNIYTTEIKNVQVRYTATY